MYAVRLLVIVLATGATLGAFAQECSLEGSGTRNDPTQKRP